MSYYFPSRSANWLVKHFATLLGFAFCVTPLAVRRAAAQAVPAATWPTGDTAADQPLAGQQLGFNLTLNQGVNAINAENESINRYGLAVQAEGGAQTNFFGTQTEQVTAAYVALSADGALILNSERSRFYALYQPEYNIYPQFSDVNNFRQSAFLSLDHVLSEHFGLNWNATAARYLSLTQFLPQSLGIGGIGIVVPTLQSKLLDTSSTNTNVATNVGFRYLQSARTTWTGSLTGSYFLLVPANPGTTQVTAERYLAGGADLRMEYQWTLKDSFGAALTPIYIAGIQPAGHSSAETLEAIYQRQMTATTKIEAGAGPLFIQSTSHQFGSIQTTSYALNASIAQQARQSEFQLSYNRSFVVNFLSPAITANQVSLGAHVPLPHHLLLTGAGSYTQNSGTYSGRIGGGSVRIAYLLGQKAQIYGVYSGTSQDVSIGLPELYNFNQNKFGAGIRFNLGNPVTNGGEQ